MKEQGIIKTFTEPSEANPNWVITAEDGIYTTYFGQLRAKKMPVWNHM